MIFKLQSLNFSRWHLWNERGTLLEGYEKDEDLFGVYAIALSRSTKPGDPMNWQKVRYIGMANTSGGLARRWTQFERAFLGKRGHSGGNSIAGRNYEIVRTKEGFRIRGLKLFVAACVVPVPKDCDRSYRYRKQGEICYLEHEAFAQFVEARPRLKAPMFNKGGTGKGSIEAEMTIKTRVPDRLHWVPG